MIVLATKNLTQWQHADRRSHQCQHFLMSRPNVRNPELIEAMAAFSGTAAQAERLARAARIYRALRTAVVIVPRHETSMTMGKRDVFTRTLAEPDGRESFPVYTDFDVAPADTRLWVVPVIELCKNLMPLGVGIRVNPGSSHGGLAPAHWVRAIAEGSIEAPPLAEVVETQERILGFRPSKGFTAALRLRLTQGLVASRAISMAFVVEAVYADHPSAPLVGVVVDQELTTAERKVLAAELFAWVKPALGEIPEIYFEVLNVGEARTATLTKVGPAFYRRSS